MKNSVIKNKKQWKWIQVVPGGYENSFKGNKARFRANTRTFKISTYFRKSIFYMLWTIQSWSSLKKIEKLRELFDFRYAT